MKINEGFEVKDLKLVLQPLLHIDEFKSKLGKDDQNIVISFLLADKNAAIDLVDFLERGYEFVIDADISASEIKPGNYLVFLEIARRKRVFTQIVKILSDLSAASDLNINDWKFKYMKEENYHPLRVDVFKKEVPLSPKAYRDKFLSPINTLKANAGLSVDSVFDETNETRILQHAAGII
jgi:hypothetical protein